MRAVLQRVSEAMVTIRDRTAGKIGNGLLVFAGIEGTDDLDDVEWLVGKISRMRIFPDAAGHMNRSLLEIDGSVLVVSQFTLHASTKKGNRPSFIRAARPDAAVPLYEAFVKRMSEAIGRPVATGEFGADMKVSLVNDGPVTICVDSKNRE
jgi:D-tyrosyl-tRNA(Tyr) deacylase